MEPNLNPENQIVTPTPIQPVKSSSKLLPILLVVLLILIIATGAYVFGNYSAKLNLPASQPVTINITPIPSSTPLPTTNPTAGWKTYTDDKYQFSIKYPGDYDFSIPTKECLYKFICGEPIVVFSKKEEIYSSLSIHHTNMNGKDFLSEIINRYDDIKISSGEINGEEAKFIILGWRDGTSSTLIYISNNVANLIITMYGDYSIGHTDKSNQELIFNTLKFSKNTEINTENWKTYKSDFYKYSIKIPNLYRFPLEDSKYPYYDCIITPSNGACAITISFPNDEEKNENTLKTLAEKNARRYGDNFSIKDEVINSYKAIKTTNQDSYTEIINVIIEHPNKKRFVIFHSTRDIKYFDQILSTLKFIE